MLCWCCAEDGAMLQLYGATGTGLRVLGYWYYTSTALAAVQFQHRTSTAPGVQYRLSANTERIQCQYRSSTEAVQHQQSRKSTALGVCTGSSVSVQNRRSTRSTVSIQYQCSYNTLPAQFQHCAFCTRTVLEEYQYNSSTLVHFQHSSSTVVAVVGVQYSTGTISAHVQCNSGR